MESSKTKLRPILVLTVIAVALGTNFLIYNSSVVNNLQPGVIVYLNQTGDGSWISSDPNTRWSIVAAIFSAGSAIGSLCAPFLAEYLGRKKGLMCSGSLSVVGGILCAMYINVLFELVLVGRLLQGFSLGVGLPLASAFVTEITPVRYRGNFNALLQTAFGTGDLCGMLFSIDAILGSALLSNYCLAITIIPSTIQIIVLIFSYDTPRHLILKERKLTKGKKALQHYQGKIASVAAMNEILSEKGVKNENDNESRREEVDEDKVNCSTFWSSKAAMKTVLLSCLLLTTLAFSQISPVMTWSTRAFQDNGVPSSTAQICTVTLGICNFVGSFIAVALMEKLGRKKLFTMGIFGCFGSIALFTTFSAILTYTDTTKSLVYALVVCLDFFLLFYSMAGAAGNTLAAEICSQNFRSLAVSLANFCLMAFSTLLIYIYDYIDKGLGHPWVFLPGSILSIIIGSYLIYAVPETAGKSLSDIKQHFDKPNKSSNSLSSVVKF